MEVVSVCPLRVASVVWQPPSGGFTLTVIAKATFRLLPGEAQLAEEQEYPNDDDNHWNDDPARSLYSPSDLVPFKQRPDILLVGHAFAPRKEPVRALVARLTIGDVDKAIEVTGDRAFSPDGKMREPARFVKMPLRYERTAGGPDTWNPVGVRSDARPDAYGAVPLPNLLPAGSATTSRLEVYSPVAFGPIAPMWPSRRKHLGQSAAQITGSAWNNGPLPEDIDPAYFNSAPEDQRPTELHDDQRMVLENLHPDHPRLLTRLPGVRPCAFIDIAGQPPQRLPMQCDTLWIDTDRSICTVVWRGQLALSAAAQPGRVLVTLEEGENQITFEDLQRKLGGAGTAAAQEVTAIVELVSVKEPPSSRMTPPPAPIRPERVEAESAPPTPPALASTGGFPRAAMPLPPPPAAPTSSAFAAAPAATTNGALTIVEEPPDSALPTAAPADVDAQVAEPSPATHLAPRLAVPPGAVDLVWFEPAILPKLRQAPAYREILAGSAAAEALDNADRRAVFDVLTRAAAADEEGLFSAMAGAVTESGQLEPPLLVVDGELCVVFDEVATLEAMSFAASPFAASDSAVKEALDAAAGLLATPRIHASIGIAGDFIQRIQEAFVAGSRALVRSHIDALAARILLSQRAFQRRAVFGGPHFSAQLTPLGGAEPIPAYLPEALSARLPMFARLHVRLLVEAHLPQDQHESHPLSLRVLALGRVT